MKPATTGERIVWGEGVCDDAERLALHRESTYYVLARERARAAAIDAAIAEAVEAKDAEIAARLEALENVAKAARAVKGNLSPSYIGCGLDAALKEAGL
jgi:hypothetical protein